MHIFKRLCVHALPRPLIHPAYQAISGHAYEEIYDLIVVATTLGVFCEVRSVLLLSAC